MGIVRSLKDKKLLNNGKCGNFLNTIGAERLHKSELTRKDLAEVTTITL